MITIEDIKRIIKVKCSIPYEVYQPILIGLTVFLFLTGIVGLSGCNLIDNCLHDKAYLDPQCDALTSPELDELLQRHNDGNATAVWQGNVELSDGYNKDLPFDLDYSKRSITASDGDTFTLDATFYADGEIHVSPSDSGTTYKGTRGVITNGEIDLKGLSGDLQYDDITGEFEATR